MARMIGRKRLHHGAVVSCCWNPGCNWNSTTAINNLPLSAFLVNSSSSSVKTDVSAASLMWTGIIILVLFVLVCVFVLCWSRLNKKGTDQPMAGRL